MQDTRCKHEYFEINEMKVINIYEHTWASTGLRGGGSDFEGVGGIEGGNPKNPKI